MEQANGSRQIEAAKATAYSLKLHVAKLTNHLIPRQPHLLHWSIELKKDALSKALVGSLPFECIEKTLQLYPNLNTIMLISRSTHGLLCLKDQMAIKRPRKHIYTLLIEGLSLCA
jgi:hypothetical protein